MPIITSSLNLWVPLETYVGDPVTLSLGLTSANVQLLPDTAYRLWSSVDGFFKFGPDNTVAASTSSNPITGKLDTLHLTDRTNVWLAGIVSSGSGVLFASQIQVRPV